MNGNGKWIGGVAAGLILLIVTVVLANNNKPTRVEMEQKDAALEQRLNYRLDRMERKIDYLVETSKGGN